MATVRDNGANDVQIPPKLRLLFGLVHDISQGMIVDGLQNNVTEEKKSDSNIDKEMTDLESKEQDLIDQITQIYQQKLVLRKQKRMKLSEKYNDEQLEQYQTNNITPFTTQLSSNISQLQTILTKNIKSPSNKIDQESKTNDNDDTDTNNTSIDINNEDAILKLLTPSTNTTTNPNTNNNRNPTNNTGFVPPQYPVAHTAAPLPVQTRNANAPPLPGAAPLPMWMTSLVS